MDAAQPAAGPASGPSPENADTRNGPGTLHGSESTEAANDGVLDSARSLWRDFTALTKDHLELALLETQRAGQSAVNMLVYAVAAALLLVTAWLGLLAAIVIGLAELGLHAGFGVLIVVALNLIGVFALYRMIRRSSKNLGFPATRRSLRRQGAASGATAGSASSAPASSAAPPSSAASKSPSPTAVDGESKVKP